MKKIMDGNIHFKPSEEDKKLPLYLTNVGKWTNQYPICRENGWPNFQWIQCISGKGILKLRGETSTLEPGQGMLLYPDECHEYYSTEEPWGVYWFSFNGSQIKEFLSYLRFGHSQVLRLFNPKSVIEKIDRMIQLAAPDSLMGYMKCSAVLYEVLLDLFQYGSVVSARSREQYFSQLTPAIQYIEKHYHRPISLEEIANQLEVSRQHTCVLFQETLGLRPIEYVNKVRTSKARELLLEEPHHSISEISSKVGYEDTSYFIKVFKRYQGVTPHKYREHL